MKIRATVSLIALSLTLAACGGGADDAGDSATPAAEDTAAAVPGAEDAALTGEDATPAPEASESAAPADAATPSPTPSASASAAAAPAPAAAAPAPATASATPPPMFAVCAACHSVDKGDNGIGPSLAGVFGAKSGHVSTFEYSEAMKNAGLTWDEATLQRYLENPRQVVPGTTMAYNGLKNPAQRQAVINYLKGL